MTKRKISFYDAKNLFAESEANPLGSSRINNITTGKYYSSGNKIKEKEKENDKLAPTVQDLGNKLTALTLLVEKLQLNQLPTSLTSSRQASSSLQNHHLHQQNMQQNTK